MDAIRIGRATSVALLIATASSAGCKEDKATSSAPQVSRASEALASAIAACGQQLGDCATAADGDTDALAECRADFTTCRETAGAGSMNDLAAAIQACTDGAGDCASNAGGSDAQDCHDELVACLGANRPSHGPDGGARGDGDHSAPVAGCIDTLLACVEGDGSAKECAQAVRACIVDAVPAPDGVIPEDPGSAAGEHVPTGGAGMAGDPPAADAGMSMAGDPPAADAGMGMAGDPPTPDAGMAGDPPGDTCMEQFDACIAAGGSRMKCAKQQRECARR